MPLILVVGLPAASHSLRTFIVGTRNTSGMFRLRRVPFLALLLISVAPLACSTAPDGAVVFSEHCASCHLEPLYPRAPHLDMLEGWNPDLIVMTLATGLMEEQGRELTPPERIAVAEYISIGDADLDVDRRRAEELGTSLP